MDESIGRARQSINELNVALYVTKESSVEIVYESLEDVMKLPEIVILNIFLPVIWMQPCLDLSIENQKGGGIKLN